MSGDRRDLLQLHPIESEEVPPIQSENAEPADREQYSLRLYVAGHTPKSAAAIANLRQICEEHLAGRYSIEVVDLLVQPQLAAGDQILAVPTLVRRLPVPLKRIIGNLANAERVLVGLDIRGAGQRDRTR